VDAWPDWILAVVMFVRSLKIVAQTGYSLIGVFNRRLDEIFVSVPRKWDDASKTRRVRVRQVREKTASELLLSVKCGRLVTFSRSGMTANPH